MRSATTLPPLVQEPGSQRCQYVYKPDSDALSIGDWVSLYEMPSDYAHHEALLLCALSAEDWVTWIPGYGQKTLCLRQFCPFPVSV